MLQSGPNSLGKAPTDLLNELAGFPARALDGMQRMFTQQPPPSWLAAEVQNRLLLLVNHVLSQEPEAMRRMARHAKKRVQLDAAGFCIAWAITPVGLFTQADPFNATEPDLRIAVRETQWSELLKTVASGTQPEVKIFGDVLLAAEIGWVRDNVRWDIEADLARFIGDVPAVNLTRFTRSIISTLKQFAKRTAS
jgi:ubiquinone biosynthesis protein UbiJ